MLHAPPGSGGADINKRLVDGLGINVVIASGATPDELKHYIDDHKKEKMC